MIRWRVKAESRFGAVWIDRNGRQIVAENERGERQSLARLTGCVPEFRHVLEDASDAYEACTDAQPLLRRGWKLSNLKAPKEHRRK